MTRRLSPADSLTRARATIAVIAGFVAAAIVAILGASGVLERAELRAFDFMARAGQAGAHADTLVSVALLGEDDIKALGFPLPPATLDRIVDSLLAHGTTAIGIDLFRDSVGATGSLSRAVAVGTVVMAHKLGDSANRPVAPPLALPTTGRIGFSDVVLDDDDVVRRLLWIASDSANEWNSLGFATALRHLEADGATLGASADGLPRIGEWTFRPFGASDGGYRDEDDGGFQYLMDWRRTSNIPSFTLSALLQGRVPDLLMRGRMIFIGSDAPSLPDLVRLPVTLAGSRIEGTPGVFVHALGASEIIRLARSQVAPLNVLPGAAEWLVTLFFAALGAALACWERSAVRSASFLLIGVALLVMAGVLLMRSGLWIPITAPVLAGVAAAAAVSAALGAHERRTRVAIGRLFSRHVSPALAREIWERRDELRDGRRLRPQRLAATILFADLRGFSTRAEQMDPGVLLEWISEFTDGMTEEIMRCGGIVDDFAGDGIKADFGVPVARTTSDEIRGAARDAVRAALAMEATLTRLNAQWVERGLTPSAMRIGIASGPVVAGSIGSAERLKYTVVGDVVNVAARLEGFDGIAADFSERPCRILIDSATAALVGASPQLESLGLHRVKGREQPVAIYSVALHSREVSHAIS